MTPLRPGLVFRSESSNHVIVMGLSWEDCREEANERKKAKYLELTEECESNRRAFQRVEGPAVSPSRLAAGALQGSLCIGHSATRGVVVRYLDTDSPWLGRPDEGVWWWKTREHQLTLGSSQKMCSICTTWSLKKQTCINAKAVVERYEHSMSALFIFRQEPNCWKTFKVLLEQWVFSSRDWPTLSLIIFRPFLFSISFGAETTKLCLKSQCDLVSFWLENPTNV